VKENKNSSSFVRPEETDAETTCVAGTTNVLSAAWIIGRYPLAGQ